MLHDKLMSKVLVVLAASLWTTQAIAQDSQECFNVDLRDGTTQVCADVYENPLPFTPPLADTILAIHGFSETAKTWGPMKDAIFAHPVLKFDVKRIIALDLPGRQSSPPPPNLPGGPFGNLFIEDYADVVLQVIDGLKQRGLHANVLMGHSMGGLEIQAVQEKLLSEGSSLAKHGVFRAILIASVPNAGVAWTPTSGSLPAVTTPALGTYFDIPPAFAQSSGFRTTTGQIFCFDGFGTPPACTGAVPPTFVDFEPLFATLQLVGLQLPPPAPPLIPARPFARQGAFRPLNGTLLTVIGFQEDILTPAAVQLPLYQYLVGSSTSLRYRLVDTADSVHAMHILNPSGLLGDLSLILLLF